MKKFVAELIGTFMLVFVGTGAVVFGNGFDGLGHLGIAFAFGLAIVVAAYSIGTVSGAHLNPAVSIAMFVNKRLSSSELVNYILGQVVGAFIASGAVFFLLANSGMSTASLVGENALANGVTVFGGFLFEVIATFLFVLVIMTVTSESKGNGPIAGLVIGLSLMAMILVGLKITGLSVNPARSLAPAVLVGGAALQQVWIFILAPIAGGVLAALVAKNFLGTEE
ncbi:TPA: MIP/aquaporin family protein [Streptococcus pneumoniae]